VRVAGWKGTIAAIAIAATLGACSSEAPTDDGSGATQPAHDTSEAVCTKFREVAGGAFGESLSPEQVVEGLEEVGELGSTAADPIGSLAVQAAEEANAQALISGNPDQTLDALADACNEAFPI
jgi:hypothetical protein